MKKCTSLTWTLRSESKLTKAQKKILKEFFENGPNLRYGINKKQSMHRHGTSYNKNLDTLVQLRLLQHEESHRELLHIEHPNLDPIEPKLRFPAREAFKKRDFSCPSGVGKERWKKALDAYRIANYNERIGDKIGESLYRLTIWGIISHFRDEGKLPPSRIILTDGQIDPNAYQLQSKITDEDLDRVLPHLWDFPVTIPDIIQRKWSYLCKSNDKNVVYNQLFDALVLANHYYEWLNADFARFENSALKDILLHFLIPYRLNQPYANNWIKSIVKNRELFDFLTTCFAELKEYYESNQEIIREYDKILKQARKNGEVNVPKFFKNGSFFVKLPPYFHHGYYLGEGPWGYRLSYFLNELESGPIQYTLSLLTRSRKYRTKQNKVSMKLAISLPESTGDKKEKPNNSGKSAT